MAFVNFMSAYFGATKLKADLQSVLRTLESLFLFFVLIHVRYHKM